MLLTVHERHVGPGPHPCSFPSEARAPGPIPFHHGSKTGHGWHILKWDLGSSGRAAAHADLGCLQQESTPSLPAPSVLLRPILPPAWGPLSSPARNGPIGISDSPLCSALPDSAPTKPLLLLAHQATGLASIALSALIYDRTLVSASSFTSGVSCDIHDTVRPGMLLRDGTQTMGVSESVRRTSLLQRSGSTRKKFRMHFGDSRNMLPQGGKCNTCNLFRACKLMFVIRILVIRHVSSSDVSTTNM